MSSLKVYTQEEFDAMPVVDGAKQCPTGDYSNIRNFTEKCYFGENSVFGEWCSFGEGCSFGKRCSFGEWCSFGAGCKVNNLDILNEYLLFIGGLGHCKRTVYLWVSERGFYFQAGCFFGAEEKFREAVSEKYGEDSTYYKAIDWLKELSKQ